MITSNGIMKPPLRRRPARELMILDSGVGSRLLTESDVVSVGWLKSDHHPPGEFVIPAKAGIHASVSQHLVDMAEFCRNMDPRLRGGDERGASSETSNAETRMIRPDRIMI